MAVWGFVGITSVSKAFEPFLYPVFAEGGTFPVLLHLAQWVTRASSDARWLPFLKELPRWSVSRLELVLYQEPQQVLFRTISRIASCSCIDAAEPKLAKWLQGKFENSDVLRSISVVVSCCDNRTAVMHLKISSAKAFHLDGKLHATVQVGGQVAGMHFGKERSVDPSGQQTGHESAVCS